MAQPAVLSQKCASCGAVCEMYDHHYHEGFLDRPVRRWVVRAPMYYRGTQPFCTPVCSTLGTDLGELQHVS